MAKGIGNGFPMAAVVTTPGEQQTRPNISVMRETANVTVNEIKAGS